MFDALALYCLPCTVCVLMNCTAVDLIIIHAILLPGKYIYFPGSDAFPGKYRYFPGSDALPG